MTMTHKEALREAAGRYWESPIRERKLEDMQSAILAYIEARGLVLVPREPTRKMWEAAIMSVDGRAYADMLAAAPDPFKDE